MGLLLKEEASFGGYTLFAPMHYNTTYLIDNEGRLVNSWDSEYLPSESAYLLENGNLIRAALLGGNPTFNVFQGEGGRVEEFTWDGTLIWEYEYTTSEHILHHDIEVLPNGNVLMIAWERKPHEEVIAAGRDPGGILVDELWVEHIIEVEPTDARGGTIVWEWHLWDHLVQEFDPTKDNFGIVRNHPELVDLNYGGSGRDWNHANSVDYNEQLDQIIISVRHFNEIWVIDHSTTTEQAAGHSGGNSGQGGDLLYRWGNPRTYQAGDESDQKLYWQHDARWIEPELPGAGNILVFNNGPGRPLAYSSVDEITPPVDASGNYALTPGQPYGPEELAWTYTAENPPEFFSPIVSGAQRLPNGNTRIAAGAQRGTFFEVTTDGATVWKYLSPVTAAGPLTQGRQFTERANIVFRAPQYAAEFSGLLGRDLTPGGPIELEKPLGDVNSDGIVESLDALLVLQYDAGFLDTLSNLGGGDVNEDGTTNSLDAALILQLTAGLLNVLRP